MRWFISDTHFGHANVIEYSKRPFVNVAQMDDIMIGKWNNCVRPEDEVFMLGDFGLSSVHHLTDILQSLNGSKILIKGNHDGSVAKMKRISTSMGTMSTYVTTREKKRVRWFAYMGTFISTASPISRRGICVCASNCGITRLLVRK